jgi:integrase/recombinase XerD
VSEDNDEALFAEFLKFKEWKTRGGAPRPERTMRELWEEFLPTVTVEQTRRNYGSARKKGEIVFRHRDQTVALGELTPSQLTRSLLWDWLACLRTALTKKGKPLAPASIDAARKAWQSMLRHYVLRDELLSNPFAKLKFETRPGEGKRRGYFTEAQLEEFLLHCRPMLAAMCRVIARAGGLRNTEVRTLRKDQIDFEAKCAWVRRKGGKITSFLLTDDVVEVLHTWCKASRGEFVFANPNSTTGKPLSSQTFDDWFRQARRTWGKTLNGELPVPHHLRHTYATHMLAKGAPAHHVAEQMGHADTSQLPTYADLSRPDLRDAYLATANMSVADARRSPARLEHRCPDCQKLYGDIRDAAACFDGHRQRATKEVRNAEPVVPGERGQVGGEVGPLRVPH